MSIKLCATRRFAEKNNKKSELEPESFWIFANSASSEEIGFSRRDAVGAGMEASWVVFSFELSALCCLLHSDALSSFKEFQLFLLQFFSFSLDVINDRVLIFEHQNKSWYVLNAASIDAFWWSSSTSRLSTKMRTDNFDDLISCEGLASIAK